MNRSASMFFLAVASLLSFQMARPHYDVMRNATPNPLCSALSVFPRQQSPTIWKALIPQFLSLCSNGFLLCPSPSHFLWVPLLILVWQNIYIYIFFPSFLYLVMLLFDSPVLPHFSLWLFCTLFTWSTYHITIFFHLLSAFLFLSSCGHFHLVPCWCFGLFFFPFNTSTLYHAARQYAHACTLTCTGECNHVSFLHLVSL